MMRRTAWVLGVVVSVIAAIGLSRPAAAVQSEQETAAALEPAIKALEFLQIDYQILGDRSGLEFSVPRGLMGAKAHLLLSPIQRGEEEVRFFRLDAPGIYDVSGERYPGVARRALLEAGRMIDSDVQFTSRGLTGVVDARILIPAADGRVQSKVLKACLDMMVTALDTVQPVLERAGGSGQIDWPAVDGGPDVGQVAGELRVTPSGGGEPFPVPWAPWIEERIYASTIVSSDGIWRKFAKYDENEREEGVREFFGRSEAGHWIAEYLKQTYPPIKIRFWGPPGTPVSARAAVDGFSSEVTASGVIDSMYYCDVRLAPEWDSEALVALKEPRQAVVRYSVECGGQRASGTQEITIEPTSVADLGLVHLAVPQFVNEDHPWVREIISDANSLGIAPALGYTGTQNYVDTLRQMYAVWVALRNRGISYVTVHRNSSSGDAPTQTIRQFHEAISERGANCADGAAALASIFRKLGFEVTMVYPKEHVLLAVRCADSDPAMQWIHLETTAIGEVEPGPPPAGAPVTRLVGMIPERHRGENLDTFMAACVSGQQHYERGDIESWVRIEDLRRLGMKPIPVNRSELGRMPSPPPDIEATRDTLRVSKRAERRLFEFLISSASAPPAVPYTSELKIKEDIDAIETDPAAKRRLLAAVDGDGFFAQSARISAVQHALLEPAISAAMAKFGNLPDWGLEWLGISGMPWDIEVEREPDAVMYRIMPHDRITQRSWMRAQQVAGKWIISENSVINDDQAWFVTSVMNVVHQKDPSRIPAIAADLRRRIEAGEIASVEAFQEQLFASLAAVLPKEDELQKWADRELAANPKGNGRASGQSGAAGKGATEGPSGRQSVRAGSAAPSVVTDDIQMGDGPAAQAGDRVEVHYICRLSDGTVIFDSKARDGKTRSFTVGGKAIPAGVGVALIGVREGGVRSAVIPPELAYGAAGRPANNIPPDAELHYEFTVVKVNKK